MAGKTNQEDDEDAKKHWKVIGGFDAFNPHCQPIKKRRLKRRASHGQKKVKLVRCEELPEPESGIHSLAWAQAILPQSSGFLKLPIEVRTRIYEHVIDDWACGPKLDSPVMPWKKGRKFRDPDWKNAAQETAALYLLSRQVYIDVVGSGLLYRFRKFYFSSPTTMLNYLWVINPRHKDSIRTIQLDISLATYLKCFAADPPRTCGRPFEMIASCQNLQHFSLNIKLVPKHYRIQHKANVNHWQHWSYRPIPMSMTISNEVLDLVAACASLKSIRGLKSFELLWTPMWSSLQNPVPFEKNNEVRINQVVEEIRGLITSEQ